MQKDFLDLWCRISYPGFVSKSFRTDHLDQGLQLLWNMPVRCTADQRRAIGFWLPKWTSFGHWIELTGGGTETADWTVNVSVQIIRPNQTPPTAVIAPISVVMPNVPVTLDGSSSPANTAGALLVAYNWSITNAAGTVIGASSGQTASFTFTAAGTYTAMLTVTDSDGLTGTASLPIVVGAACILPDDVQNTGAVGPGNGTPSGATKSEFSIQLIGSSDFSSRVIKERDACGSQRLANSPLLLNPLSDFPWGKIKGFLWHRKRSGPDPEVVPVERRHEKWEIAGFADGGLKYATSAGYTRMRFRGFRPQEPST
jgi:hypothetical protein